MQIHELMFARTGMSAGRGGEDGDGERPGMATMLLRDWPRAYFASLGQSATR
jgi:hypothetical protein